MPNEYVFKLAEKHSELFVPNISVNPYRPDALAELEKWAMLGARVVKWLPNAIGIDLTEAEGSSLKEIYDYNPLLFDFVLKRALKLPGTDRRLPAGIFMTNPALGI